MFQVAICDDEDKYIKDIFNILKKYEQIKYVDLEIDTYCNGKVLLKSKKKYDIIFLDIEMKSIDGIEVAKKIREIDMQVPIVYVTNYEEYWRKAYKVHAFQFIVKPINEKELFTTMDDFLDAYKELTEKKVQLKCEEGIVFAIQSDIYYFYIKKKKMVYVKTSEAEYTVKENLRDIFDKLDDKDFYMSHKSCIINLRYVRSLENGYDIIMKDGEFLPLAQNRRSEFLGKIGDRCIEVLKGERL